MELIATGRQTSPRAALGLLAVCLLWGLNWPAVKLALDDVDPWTLRTIAPGLGAISLLVFAKWRGISLLIPRGRPRLHLLVASLLNIAAFSIFTSYAQLGTTTGRAAFCTFTMPVWATLLAALILKERLDRSRVIALLFATAGLAVLLQPLLSAGLPLGVVFALCAAWSWAAGTVYLKWAAIDASPIAVAAWQLVAGAVAVAFGGVVFGLHGGTLHLASAIGLAYNAFAGNALAYFLWFGAVKRMTAATATLGTLMVPVIGTAASALILGDGPTGSDFIGFVLIVLASVCALAFSPRGGDSSRPIPLEVIRPARDRTTGVPGVSQAGRVLPLPQSRSEILRSGCADSAVLRLYRGWCRHRRRPIETLEGTLYDWTFGSSRTCARPGRRDACRLDDTDLCW